MTGETDTARHRRRRAHHNDPVTDFATGEFAERVEVTRHRDNVAAEVARLLDEEMAR